MIRLTTDNQFRTNAIVNTFFAKDEEIYMKRCGDNDKDISLYDWIRKASESINAEICSENAKDLSDEMCDLLWYGPESPEGVLAYLYLAALQAVEMRGRLKKIEDIICDEYEDYDLDRLRQMVQKFSPGQVVWVVEKDEDGNPCDVTGYVFVTSINNVALVSPVINGSTAIDDILRENVRRTAMECAGFLGAYPIADCYESKETAEKALTEMER